MGYFFSKEDRPSEESFPDLLHLLQSGINSDVTLVCGGQSFSVHTRILEAHSDVFLAKFESMHHPRTVPVTEVGPKTLQHFLYFLYSGKVMDDVTFPYALKLYEAARLFEVRPLEKKCLSLVKSGLEHDNVCEVLGYSDAKKYAEMKDVAIAYLVANPKFLLSETWRMFVQNKKDLANDVLAALARNK